MSEKNTPEGVKKVQLSVKQIKEDLKNGLDRKAIATKYGLNFAAVKAVFSHPKLKGLKVKRTANVEIEDDDPDAPVYTPTPAQAKLATTAKPAAKPKAEQPAPQPQPQPEPNPSEGIW